MQTLLTKQEMWCKHMWQELCEWSIK